ncbi:MAG: hypothetical protein ABII90_04080 [Bacteroidota bacterium]
MKISQYFSIALVILIIALLSAGCSENTSSTTGQIWTDTSYYYPNWMPDGRVVANRVDTTYQRTYSFFEGETNVIIDVEYYIVTMEADGSDEENLIQLSGFADKISCSPVGEKIAWLAEGEITVSDYHGNISATLEYATEFDWSPSGDKIVYQISQDNIINLYTINIDGSDKNLISSEAEEGTTLGYIFAGPVSWRDQNFISLVRFSPIMLARIFLINSDGSNHKLLVNGTSPQNYSDSEILYIGCEGSYIDRYSGVYKINIDGSNNTKLFDFPYETIETMKLSFDKNKIVYSDAGNYIHVINISDGQSTRLK